MSGIGDGIILSFCILNYVQNMWGVDNYVIDCFGRF